MAARCRSPESSHVDRCGDKSCLRCVFIRRRGKWLTDPRLMADLGRGPEPLVAEQPDEMLPWGLGCVACSRFAGSAALDSVSGNRWATFQYGAAGKTKVLNLEDMLRHVGKSNSSSRQDGFHKRAMEFCRPAPDPDAEPLVKTEHGAEARDDVPTPSQYRICYGIIKRVTPPLRATYEVECTRAREAGDATALRRRGGESAAPKIASSIAAALFEQDRQLLQQGKILAAGIAQDARKGLEMTKIRFVSKSLEVHTRVLSLLDAPGKKAVDKVNDLERAIDEFCNGSAELKTKLLNMVRVSTADGELGEQLGLRLAKERLFPNQVAVLRCKLHMTQRTLENCVKLDQHCFAVLDQFILKTSTKGKNGEPGAFARAVRNSSRLQVMLGKAVAESVAEVALAFDKIPNIIETGASTMPSSAPQRFDSMLSALQRFVWNARGCVRFLAQEAASKTDTSKWASDLLDFLFKRNGAASPQNVLLLALLAEFVEATNWFVRQQDVATNGLQIARFAAQLEALESRLGDLFDVEDADGRPKTPRALSKTYTHGYVQMIRESLALTTSSTVIAAGKVAAHLEGSEESVRDWALEELGSILNVKKLFLAQVHAEVDQSVALALRPFDVDDWAKTTRELGPTLKPLAEAVNVDLADLCSQFQSAWPAVLTLRAQHADLGTLWATALRQAGRRIKRLDALKKTVVFMLAAFPATGEVERNFSIMQGMSSHRRAGVSTEILRSLVKIAIDGPKTEDFVWRHGGAWCPSQLCRLAQNWYFAAFGGKRFTKDKGQQVRFATAQRGNTRPGSMSHAISEKNLELESRAATEPMSASGVAAVKRSMSERWSDEQASKLAGAAETATKKQKQWKIDAAPSDEAVGMSSPGVRRAPWHALALPGQFTAAAFWSRDPEPGP